MSELTFPMAVEIVPLSVVSAATTTMVMTARTTAYSAMVWPSSRTRSWRRASRVRLDIGIPRSVERMPGQLRQEHGARCSLARGISPKNGDGPYGAGPRARNGQLLDDAADAVERAGDRSAERADPEDD